VQIEAIAWWWAQDIHVFENINSFSAKSNWLALKRLKFDSGKHQVNLFLLRTSSIFRCQTDRCTLSSNSKYGTFWAPQTATKMPRFCARSFQNVIPSMTPKKHKSQTIKSTDVPLTPLLQMHANWSLGKGVESNSQQKNHLQTMAKNIPVYCGPKTLCLVWAHLLKTKFYSRWATWIWLSHFFATFSWLAQNELLILWIGSSRF